MQVYLGRVCWMICTSICACDGCTETSAKLRDSLCSLCLKDLPGTADALNCASTWVPNQFSGETLPLRSEQSVVVSIPLQTNLPSGGKGRLGELPPARRAQAPEPFQVWSRSGHTIINFEEFLNIILQFWKTGESSNVDNSTWRILKLLKAEGFPSFKSTCVSSKILQQNQHFSQKYLNMAFLRRSSSPLRSRGWLSSRSSSSHSFSEARTRVYCHPDHTAKLCLPQPLAWRAGSGSWALTKTGTLFFVCLYFILYRVFCTVTKHVL